MGLLVRLPYYVVEMDQAYHLDDRYTDGIWYDTYNGDFAEIQEAGDGDGVHLINPETNEVYWECTMEEWVEDEQSDFTKVSDEAVEDPVAVVNRAVRILSRNNVNELAGVPYQEAVDLRYARQQVEISEK